MKEEHDQELLLQMIRKYNLSSAPYILQSSVCSCFYEFVGVYDEEQETKKSDDTHKRTNE